MIKIIDRYIAREVIVASLFVLFLLIILRSIFGLLHELSSVGRGTYEISDALLYTALLIPIRLVDFFPMSVLIGALFGLGHLAQNSELTVMRAAGMTTWRISGSTIKASLLLIAFMLIISEFIAPQASKSARQLYTNAVSGGELSVSKTGLWAKKSNQIIQIGSILNDGQLKDITLYEMVNGHQIKTITKAQSASHEGAQWLLNDVLETTFLENEVVAQHYQSKAWDNPLEVSQIELLSLEPNYLNLYELFNYLIYLRQNGLETDTFQLTFWSKLLQPLAVAVMMFLACAFVFGPMRNVSMGARVLSGVMLGFAFHIINRTFGPISLVYNLWSFVGAVMPIALFALLGYYLMKKNS